MHAANGLGGSVAKRTLNCPGWRALVPKDYADVPSEYAQEGTRLHDIIARLAGVWPADREPCDEPKVIEALAAYDARWPWAYREQTLVEQQVALPIEGAFGTADAVVVYPERLVVCDWKFGDGVPVEALDNDQLLFYAAGVLATWPELRRPTLELAIMQPGRGGLKLWLVSDARVDAWLEDYTAALEQTHLERGDWCRWCPVDAAGRCPAPTPMESLGELLTQGNYVL